MTKLKPYNYRVTFLKVINATTFSVIGITGVERRKERQNLDMVNISQILRLEGVAR